MPQIIQRLVTAEGIAHALAAKRTGPDRWRARCPAHDDNNPSFDIAEKNGKPLFKCWSGCSQEAVLQALTYLGLWHAPGEKTDQRPRMTPQQIQDANLFCLVYLANIRSGQVQPTAADKARYAKYRRALEMVGIRNV